MPPTTANPPPRGIPSTDDARSGASLQRPYRTGNARLSPTLRIIAAGATALDNVAPKLTTELALRYFTRPRRKASRDYRELLPPGHRRLTLSHGSSNLVGWTWGASGPAVLLVHGWEDHAGSMLGFVEPLVALGYRVFVLDMPGHGLSPKASTHLLDATDALARMVDEYGPFESIVAHSYGAAATCLMLEQSPAFKPGRLSLLAPMPDLDQHLRVFSDVAMLSDDRARRLRERVERLLGRQVDEICALRSLHRLDLPALVIHDRHDTVIPHGAGERFAENLSGSRFVSTSRLGHRRVLKCRNVLAEVLRHHRRDEPLSIDVEAPETRY